MLVVGVREYQAHTVGHTNNGRAAELELTTNNHEHHKALQHYVSQGDRVNTQWPLLSRTESWDTLSLTPSHLHTHTHTDCKLSFSPSLSPSLAPGCNNHSVVNECVQARWVVVCRLKFTHKHVQGRKGPKLTWHWSAVEIDPHTHTHAFKNRYVKIFPLDFGRGRSVLCSSLDIISCMQIWTGGTGETGWHSWDGSV